MSTTKTKPQEIKIGGYRCAVRYASYGSGRVAIQLNVLDEYNEETEPYAVATVNLPMDHIEKDEVIIKNWSENEGIMDALQKAGIIGPSLRKIPTGFVEADVCKLLIDPNSDSGIPGTLGEMPAD